MTRDSHALEVREHLYRDVVLLADLWKEYRELFGSEESVALLNEHAWRFFARVQRLILQEVAMAISRLTEDAETRAGRNVSMWALLADPRAGPKSTAGSEIRARLQEAKDLATGIRRHRNKVLAHRDHAVAMGKERLPHVPVDTVEQVIRLLVAAHELYSISVLERDPDHEMHALGGAADLVASLRAAPTRRERLMAEAEEEMKRSEDSGLRPNPGAGP